MIMFRHIALGYPPRKRFLCTEEDTYFLMDYLSFNTSTGRIKYQISIAVKEMINHDKPTSNKFI